MVGKYLQRIYRDNVPSREALEQSRLLRPVAHRVLAPALWRFTRRSVPRGVALGILVGIFLMIPGLQMAGAALLALPFRANVPIAVVMTFLSNPVTTPMILAGSLYIGNGMLGGKADVSQFLAMVESGAGLTQWSAWLLSDAAPALVFGLLVVAVVSAAIGYLLALWIWQARIASRWRNRRAGAPSLLVEPRGELRD